MAAALSFLLIACVLHGEFTFIIFTDGSYGERGKKAQIYQSIKGLPLFIYISVSRLRCMV